MIGIVIAGPTGVGKTALSIELAKKLDAEIISCDSAQIYKGLDIGTAKITPSETMGVVHHMIDVAEPIYKYSVGDFQRKVDEILISKEKERKTMLLVGGTGLYIDAITEGLADLPTGNNEIRQSLEQYSNEEIYEKLLKVDEESATNIQIENKRRLIRALEVYMLTGEKFSVLSKKNIKKNNYDFIKIALDMDRTLLYDRINRRVDLMIEKGLVEEAKDMYEKYGEKFKRLKIIGYSECIDYFEDKCTIKEMADNIKKNSRRYAKRQLTWFKHDKKYIWYRTDQMDIENIATDIMGKIK